MTKYIKFVYQRAEIDNSRILLSKSDYNHDCSKYDSRRYIQGKIIINDRLFKANSLIKIGLKTIRKFSKLISFPNTLLSWIIQYKIKINS